jgi:hypothetical protein
MSDPAIDENLPAKQFRVNEQTSGAIGFYRIGRSIIGVRRTALD